MRCLSVYFLFFLGILLIQVTIALSSGSVSSFGNQNPSDLTGNEWFIDHVVIVVYDLNTSIEHYQNAGFTVVPGGVHPGGFSHNALIAFSDGSYLELYAPVDPALFGQMEQLVDSGTFETAMAGSDAVQKRFMHHIAAGPGIADFALSAPGINLAFEVNRTGDYNLTMEGPIPMSRIRPDGFVLSWQVDVPVGQNATALPFLIRDVTPRSYRVPAAGNATVHANGATGIQNIQIGVGDPNAITRLYTILLDSVPQNQVGDRVRYILKDSTISVCATPDTITKERSLNITLKTGNGSVADIL